MRLAGSASRVTSREAAERCAASSVSFTTTAPRLTAQALERACASLAHRGPDDEGIHVDGPVGLGHRRLSIIDVSAAGRQPMTNEDETVWLTYNGEIYNFRELRRLLEARGHRFRSHTDSEVLVHGWEEWGERPRRPPERDLRLRDLGRAPRTSCSWRATASA